MIKRLLNEITRLALYNKTKKQRFLQAEQYDFNKSNPLGGNGERVDIHVKNGTSIDFRKLDMYQKSHYRRYEFAKNHITNDVTCGDFACGTGYGTILLSTKANKVIGADINKDVITAIQTRYTGIKNIEFHNTNLLDLKFDATFEYIISFETIEHFPEKEIDSLLAIFYKAIKPNGKLIFSTPYKQEQTEEAIKLGHHLTFHIDEKKLEGWLTEAGFRVESFKFQNYETHTIQNTLGKKDFIIGIASKS